MSMMRDCEVVQVGRSKFYLLLAVNEHDTLQDSGRAFGPFRTYKEALDELTYHSNPGQIFDRKVKKLSDLPEHLRRLVVNAKAPSREPDWY